MPARRFHGEYSLAVANLYIKIPMAARAMGEYEIGIFFRGSNSMAKMWIGGEEVAGSRVMEVTSPFDGRVLDSVPQADASMVDRALSIAAHGAERMRKTTGYQRYQWLSAAARKLQDNSAEFARRITLEEGKILAEAELEVARAAQTLEVSAEEAKRIVGQAVPLDGAPGTANKLGFTLRVPCGVVAAITPFNFPLNLVVHKVGPALAAGNAVILKPASDTPLTALALTALLLEVGIPGDALQCLTGLGKTLSEALCGDRRVRKISFTGSFEVGETICRVAGMKKVTMELGANSPLIVMDDADMEKVLAATVATGYANAGQVCISTQRVLVDQRIYGDFLSELKPRVEALTTGDPLAPTTKVGPMIRPADAARVVSWLEEAVAQGGRLITGGECEGAMVRPAILADATPTMKVTREELFGPAVAVTPFADFDQALALADHSRYGLSAGIFTSNLDRAMRFVQQVEAGCLHVNGAPQWRVDLMPYGGLKDSGMGKEGPAHAIREMTEEKMVVFHL